MWFNNLKIQSKIFSGFFIILFLMVVVSISVYINTTSMLDTYAWVSHTEVVIGKANKLEKLLVDQETGLRGYLIAGLDDFLEPYNKGTKEFKTDIMDLTKTVDDNPAQVERLTLLNKKYNSWIQDISEPMIQFRKDVNNGIKTMEQLSEEERKQKGKQYMDAMRAIVAEFVGIEANLNEERKANADDSSNFLIWFTFLASGLAVILGIFISIVIARKISVPIFNLVRAAEKLAIGDISVEVNNNSKDEAGQLAEAFDKMVQSQKDKVNAAKEIADGKMIKVNLASDADALGIAFNKEIEAISELLNETRFLTESAKDGKLFERGNPAKFSGAWQELIVGINNILDEVIRPINEGADVLKIMSNGDFTSRVKGEYKGDHQIIKNSINSVAETLNKALIEVSEAVAATASATSEISSSSEEMAAGSQEQSTQTADIAGAVEEMTKTIIETSQSANIAADNSKRAIGNAKNGAEKIQETKNGMVKIVSSVESTGKIISSLAQKTDQIGLITQVIDEIADQTNLLALNAAIEAARAGDQGRGFAVVADEVRKLAERTTKATKEIADTIQTVQSEAKQADTSMVEAGDSVKTGMELTEQVSVILFEILEVSNKVSDMVDQVATASEEQSSAAEQISKSIESISNVTHQSAASTQQIAVSAEDLNRLVTGLQGLIENFTLDNRANLLGR